MRSSCWVVLALGFACLAVVIWSTSLSISSTVERLAAVIGGMGMFSKANLLSSLPSFPKTGQLSLIQRKDIVELSSPHKYFIPLPVIIKHFWFV